MRLSVVMSVFNDARFVERSVASILAQTFRDFEYIILNDGSTDGSTEILRRLAAADPRVVLVEQENRGLVASLNRGFAMARGEIVARMDGDDEALPERFERQLAFLDANPDFGVVGVQTVNVNSTGQVVRLTNVFPRTHELFLDALEAKPVMSHPGAMIRKAVFDAVGGYRTLYRHCEDYDLWLRLSETTKLCSLDDVLMRYRVNDGQVTVRHVMQVAIGAAIAWEAHVARQAGKPDPSDRMTALPDPDHLDELDAIFGEAGIAKRVRSVVAPKLLYSMPALAAGGARLLGRYVAEGGERPPVTRTVARMLRHGRFVGAGQLAASLSRSYLLPAH